MTTTELLKTPLFDWHVAHGGRMVDFAGWSMPVQYTSIIAEHNATRTAATLFDVSHMGRFRFTGPGAQSFLDGLVTRRVSDLQAGQVRYSLVTNDQGGILDDVLVYHLPHAEGGTYFGMVVNASNREKIVRWIDDHLGDRGDVRFTDVTLATAMIAVQGPRALELLQPHIQFDLASMKYYHAVELFVQEKTTVVSRTGYTGEDGFELIVPASIAADLWEKLINDGASIGVQPAGLGARDTLRLEAGMPLYGHELTEETTPLEAGLGFAVNLEDRNFPGADAMRRSRTMARSESASAWNSQASALRANIMESSPATSPSAKSPAALSHPLCKNPSPWATCHRNKASPAQNCRSTSAARGNRPVW